MKIIEEIKVPSYQSEPDFVTGRLDENETFDFDCSCCGVVLKIDFQRQIKYSWNGNSDRLTESERTQLKRHYGIGLSEKAHDGGFPVFDNIACVECGQQYVTYCGVREFSNSAYIISVLGIQKIN